MTTAPLRRQRAGTVASMLGYSAATARSREPSGCDEHPTRPLERAAVAESFRHFLRHWWFVPESGTPRLLEELWPGQVQFADATEAHDGLIMLKAGKLGFTELECAFDAWRFLYGPLNCRVNLFSYNLDAAKELIGKVKFGLERVPEWLGIELTSETKTELWARGGRDDTRRMKSWPASPDTAIDVSAHHSHVDELARMPWPKATWAAIESTVTPGGTVHILSRGRGEDNDMKDVWKSAVAGGTIVYPLFVPWDQRPRTPSRPVRADEDPNAVWYSEKQASMTTEQLNWLAPRTAEEALSGEPDDPFVPKHVWDACHDPYMPKLDYLTPIVLSADAGVTDDLFAITAISRHPDHDVPDGQPACHRSFSDPAIRAVRIWRPEKATGTIDYSEPRAWLWWIVLGGCALGHPNPRRNELSAEPGCEACSAGHRVPPHNVVCVTYDAYQLHGMMQELGKVVWTEAFSQGGRRLEADANLRKLAITRSLAHNGDPTLSEHIANAKAQTSKTEDTRLRMVKSSPSSKIDAGVSASMGIDQCLALNMGNAVRG